MKSCTRLSTGHNSLQKITWPQLPQFWAAESLPGPCRESIRNWRKAKKSDEISGKKNHFANSHNFLANFTKKWATELPAVWPRRGPLQRLHALCRDPFLSANDGSRRLGLVPVLRAHFGLLPPAPVFILVWYHRRFTLIHSHESISKDNQERNTFYFIFPVYHSQSAPNGTR